MKIKITEEQFHKIKEAQYNYHSSHAGVDTKNPKPHGSDNIHRMSGRGTGHFGSGLYFSTYKTSHERKDYDDKYGEYSDFGWRNRTPNFIEVGNKVYRVDFDIYKNLYRVRNAKEGEFLFKTLKTVNNLFYSLAHDDEAKTRVPQWVSSSYVTLKNNFYKLGIKFPEYRQFLKMIYDGVKDYEGGRKSDGTVSSHASMSTRFMEYAGFNGVNVSGIPEYDNTTHGSVIYDMSKVSHQPVEVKKNIGWIDDIEKDVIGGYDMVTKLLRGGKLVTHYDEFNALPENTQVFIMKRYKKFLDELDLEKIGETAKKVYLSTLHRKMVNGVMDDTIDYYTLRMLVANGLNEIIYDPSY